MSTSHVKPDKETESLKKNLTEQLDRLMAQLVDLELEKANGDMDAEEYKEQYSDTIEQLQELNDSLSKMKTGNLGLLDDISSMQLAIQSAISSAFHAPDILALFVARQPEQLRERLSMVERDKKVNKLSAEKYAEQKTEILIALVKLRAPITQEEEAFLNAANSIQAKGFINADSSVSGAHSSGTSTDKVLKFVSGT